MRTKLKWKKIKIKVTFLPFPRRHKTIFSFIWTLNFIYSTSTTADTQSNVSEEIKWLLTLAQTVQQPLVFLELNWKQKPWSSSLNTVTMKPEPMLASCGLAGFGVQGFRLVKLSLSRQTEVDWSESKQAAMSPHSQLYCFTLQTILSIWLHKISVCVCVCWSMTDRAVIISTSGSDGSKCSGLCSLLGPDRTLEHPSTHLLVSSGPVSKQHCSLLRLWSQGARCTAAQSSLPPGPLRRNRQRKLEKKKKSYR